MKYQLVQIVLEKGQEWPQFVRPATEEVLLPEYVGFFNGGVESRGFGNRVLTLKTNGVMIQDGIDAALAIAHNLGLNATVARNDQHFMELCGGNSGNVFVRTPRI